MSGRLKSPRSKIILLGEDMLVIKSMAIESSSKTEAELLGGIYTFNKYMNLDSTVNFTQINSMERLNGNTTTEDINLLRTAIKTPPPTSLGLST